MHLLHKVTAMGMTRFIDDKETYQLIQLFDDIVGNIINCATCSVLHSQGRVIDDS